MIVMLGAIKCPDFPPAFIFLNLIISPLLILFFVIGAFAQSEIIDFESDRWVIQNGEIVNHLERKSLMGSALLKDIEFENCVIEVDIAVTDDNERSYPGIIFRRQSEKNYERFYIRPHRTKLYSDVLQYTPVINSIASILFLVISCMIIVRIYINIIIQLKLQSW